jgi:hypothetical protein
VPIVALTGHGPTGERAKDAMAAGCNRVLAKPCLPQSLAGTVRLVLDSTPGAPRVPR